MSAGLLSRLIAAHPFVRPHLEFSVFSVSAVSAVRAALPTAGTVTAEVASVPTVPLRAVPSKTVPGGAVPPNAGQSNGVPLRPGELVAFTQFLAHEIRAGAHVVDFDPDRRWHRRLYRDGRVDVWLISWLPEQGTALHDHGGSAGAFTVVEGKLSEAVLVGHRAGAGRLRERRHVTGATVGFDGRRVHDVRNLDTHPAVSVHAYSPPLTSMTFYDLEEGKLVPFAALDTDDPETPAPPVGAALVAAASVGTASVGTPSVGTPSVAPAAGGAA